MFRYYTCLKKVAFVLFVLVVFLSCSAWTGVILNVFFVAVFYDKGGWVRGLSCKSRGCLLFLTVLQDFLLNAFHASCARQKFNSHKIQDSPLLKKCVFCLCLIFASLKLSDRNYTDFWICWKLEHFNAPLLRWGWWWWGGGGDEWLVIPEFLRREEGFRECLSGLLNF